MSAPTPTTDVASVLALLPACTEVAAHGTHHLFSVSDEWYCLIGPDVHTEPLEWVTQMLPGNVQNWTATFETFGDILATHFTR